MSYFECYKAGDGFIIHGIGSSSTRMSGTSVIGNVTISILLWPSFLFCNTTTGIFKSESTFRSSNLQIQFNSWKRRLRFAPCNSGQTWTNHSPTLQLSHRVENSVVQVCWKLLSARLKAHWSWKPDLTIFQLQKEIERFQFQNTFDQRMRSLVVVINLILHLSLLNIPFSNQIW